MVTGPAHESLRHARSGEPPVVEELLSDLGAPHVVGKTRRERYEKTRTRNVDAKLGVDRRAGRNGFRLTSGRLRGDGPAPRELVPREEARQQDERRTCGGNQPRDVPLHLSNPFSPAFGTDTPSTYSISGNSGHHTRAVEKSERNMARYSFT